MPAATQVNDLLAILDFDRTIFDTKRYYHDFLDAMAAVYGPELAQELRAAEHTAQLFDPFGYLEQKGISYEQAAQIFRDHVSSPNYVFDDALELIKALERRPHTKVAILTTGSRRAQNFKLNLCPQLSHLHQEIVQGSKGEHLQRQIEDHAAVLLNGRAYTKLIVVDDRDDILAQIRPNPNHQLFHIARPGAKYQPSIERADIIHIQNLSTIISYL